MIMRVKPRLVVCLSMALLLAACSDGAGATAATTAPAGAWTPAPGTTWQWQLTGTIDTFLDVAMYDVDLFEVDDAAIERLHREGRIVVCYFSAGSVEQWRPDAERFPDATIGKPLEGWPDERWLDIRAIDDLSPVLLDRLDLARARGCDGVEPDNVDGHLNDTGFPLVAADQLAFNRWLADQAHERQLSIGLKNDLDQAEPLVDHFDWLLVEQCVEFAECDAAHPFLEAGKAVFAAEYEAATSEACAVARRLGLSLIFKDLDLGPEMETCAAGGD